MDHNINFNQLKQSTINIFNDCLLPSGCLVAAPSHMPYYPKDAKSYLYSWPGRDTGFNLAALAILGEDKYEPVLKWLWERAEDFQESIKDEYLGLIYRSYYPNGLIREHQFQPDQGATLIWSIDFKNKILNKELSELEYKVIDQLASNYKRIWHGEGFDLATEDLWEERGLKPQEGDFTYSLSACVVGMRIAGEILDNQDYTNTSTEMRNVLTKFCFDCDDNIVPRFFGGDLGIDNTPDASLSGLVWPFNIGYSTISQTKILNTIEAKLTNEFGTYRYPNDKYEGQDSLHRKNVNAGTWPLLTFWLSIGYSEIGEREKAEKYFNLVFDNIEDNYCIPEQIFVNHPIPWDGVKPLLWSHSMAIFAAWKLGYFA